jgi:L-asparagine transporter-like permease
LFLFKKIDEKFAWPSTPRIDHHNEEYIKHKEREKIIQKEKSFVQVKYHLKLILFSTFFFFLFLYRIFHKNERLKLIELVSIIIILILRNIKNDKNQRNYL